MSDTTTEANDIETTVQDGASQASEEPGTVSHDGGDPHEWARSQIPEGLSAGEYLEQVLASDDYVDDDLVEALHELAQAESEAGPEEPPGDTPVDASPPTEPPATLAIGEEHVPYDEVVKAYTERRAVAEVLERSGMADTPLEDVAQFGAQFVRFAEALDSSPTDAAEVIGLLQAAWIERYGESAESPVIDLANLDTHELTELEAALYQTAKVAQGRVGQLEETVRQLAAEAQAAAQEASEASKATAYVQQVKARFPGLDVSESEILGLMRGSGLKDPVKAFIVARHDDIVAFERAKAATAPQPGPGARVPKGPQSTKTFDSRGKSVEEIASLYARGYVPLKRDG